MEFNLQDIFVDGAQWWSEQGNFPMTDHLRQMAQIEAAARFTRTARIPSGTILLGQWHADDPRRAFVDGAAWYEWKTTGFTMWTSDTRTAESEAERRFDYWSTGTKRPVEQTPRGD